MNAARIIDKYMPELMRLNNEDKITIIENLLVSMKVSAPSKLKRPDVETLFSGNWENEIPATELADEYRASRYFDSEKKIDW